MGNCITGEVSPMESTKLTIKRKGHERCVVQAMLFRTVMSSRVEVFRKNGLLLRNLDSVTGVWVMITLVGSAPEVECVILVVAVTGTTRCFTVIEMEQSDSFVHWEASLTEPNCREPSRKESSLRAPSHKKLSQSLTTCNQPRLS